MLRSIEVCGWSRNSGSSRRMHLDEALRRPLPSCVQVLWQGDRFDSPTVGTLPEKVERAGDLAVTKAVSYLEGYRRTGESRKKAS